ncbi:alpha/beta hydrolase [Algoriphagus halophilus]|uniref:S-formylglutathione hydrolase FrmB n=1 Tax=Algoriphagus halophilus TaxID=226505 RepID=A0A1N6FPU9_9BACT|nr:alpha/beta hydrolase-fold protein [Algoriphagus halophilus]SIN97242.1 S-formylglutathione hydrolase FrmB [Algoriphagus halophilus]
MNSFRSIELSDEMFEQSGLRFLTVKTPNLKGRGDICLYVPKGIENLTDLPIYILLHGVYGSAWVWAMKGGAHVTAKRLMESGEIRPAIIAMPSDGLWGDGSGYLTHQELDFAEWIVSDVPKAIRENISNASEKSPICIGGLSMGGYGALKLGTQYPEIFSAISAHSAITRFSEMSLFVEESLESYKLRNTENDVIDLVKRKVDSLPAIRFDCGLNDELIEGNRLLHSQFKKLGVNHEYVEFSGGHEWEYWRKHLKKSLYFFDIHCRN